jgi:hypothetical protein
VEAVDGELSRGESRADGHREGMRRAQEVKGGADYNCHVPWPCSIAEVSVVCMAERADC